MHSYFTDSMLLLAGVSLYAAIHHIALGVQRGMNRAHLVFGGMALCLVIATLAQTAGIRAGSVAEMAAALRWNLAGVAAFYLLLPFFTVLVSQVGSVRWGAALALPMLVFFIVNLVSPYSLQYAEIDSLRTVELPWRETLNYASGRISLWFMFAALYTQFLSLYALATFLVAYRRTGKFLFIFFSFSLFLFFCLSIEGILARMAIIQLPQLGLYAYLVMQITMSAALIRDSHNRIIGSEQRFKALVQQSPLSILLLSPEGRVTQVNRAFETLWGVGADKIMDYDMLQDRQLADLGVLPYIRQGLAGSPAEIPPVMYNPAENPVVTGPHSNRLVRSFVYPIKDAQGKVLEVTMLQEDITERMKLQQALLEREHDLRSILDNLPSLIGYWDRNLRNRFANRAYEEWYGIDAGSIPGKHLRELLGEEMFRENMPYIEKVLRGEAQMFERKLVSADGASFRHSLIHYVPDIRDDEVNGFYVLVSNVSALKNSEHRLARSQAVAHIGSWEMEIKTGKHWWSDETYRIFGIGAGQPVTLQLIAERIHSDDRDRVIGAFLQATNSPPPASCNIEHRIVLPDGSLKWLHLMVEITHAANGAPLLSIAVVQDITASKLAALEQQHLQKQLMQSQKMESIGHLAGGIAHDFNNMLGAILGYAQLLRQVSGSEVPSREERIRKYVREILTAAERAKELIKQMLAFSRQNTDDESSAAPVTLISPVLKEVVSLLRSSIPSTIAINVNIENDTLSTRIKPVQLHQILLNLVINARDAIPEYGQISVELKQYTGSGTCNSCNQDFNGAYALVSVRDTGDGIPEEVLGRIFDPFFTTKSIGKGTGMGLSVVHGHVHAVGGHITVESQPGRGTAIHVLLPQAGGESGQVYQQAVVEPVPGNQSLGGLSIMVVDDERVVSSMLYDLLSHHGAQVITFNESGAALAAFRQNPQVADLVVTDETMPNLSGIDMAKAMLQLRPDLPVVLCTGYSEHVNADIAEKSGIAEFVYKPVDMKKLISRICELCAATAKGR